MFVTDQPVPGTSGVQGTAARVPRRPLGIRLSRRLQRQSPIEISSDSAVEGSACRPVPVDDVPDVQQVVEISSEQPEEESDAAEIIPGPSTSRCVL